jgi:putative intracellular protease/amidase
MGSGKILIIATSATDLNGLKTGSWLEEFAAPYYIWKEAGYDVVLGSTNGGKIPLDEASLSGDFLTEAAKKFQGDDEAVKLMENSVAAKDVTDTSEYAAIFIPGGHGISADGPDNPTLQKLLVDFYESGKVVSSVCHGPIALTHVKLSDGKWLLHGKKATGFTNSEEEAVEKVKYMPFSIEDRIKEEGALYTKGGDWSSHVVTDGKLITGQNPQSSEGVAKAVLEALKA